MLRQVIDELKEHAAFAVFGAVTGVAIMLLLYKIPPSASHRLFYVLHPAHVVLSAVATTSMYTLHRRNARVWAAVLIGYVGSIGIATMSDSVIPYLGEALLDLPNREIHLGFVEEWWLVNPAALLGIMIALYRPTTKIPHSGHVLLSTWASSFHMIIALGGAIGWGVAVALFAFLFIAVWVPCCLSDIILPVMFAGGNGRRSNQPEE
ncbi:MAG: hypothetical protein HQ592_13725 [Planctomycetes bacterium]|nr:hypothetical protein [Planctomycetota bacterium]